MTLEEAAAFYRGSVSLLERIERIVESLDLDRNAREVMAKDALEYAKVFERAMESELHKSAGGRYWDPVNSRMVSAANEMPELKPTTRIKERVVECRTRNGRCIYPTKGPCESHGGCLGG